MSVGKVYLVGAGPGDPGLLTVKGQRCLAEADLVLYDGLVNPLLLRHTHAQALRTCRVEGADGRRLDQDQINRQLIKAAQSGQTVVRLKGGDPFIFGRGSEEAAALSAAGIPFEVVPGITAATACAVYAGISLTHRQHASAVAFITGHEDPAKEESALRYDELARFPGTLVFYMGLHRLAEIAQTLMEHGKPAETPVAVICRGTTPHQQTVQGTLADVAERAADAKLHAPSLIIIGDCVSLRETVNWFESKPLFGVSIGITTPEHQADGPIDLALQLGAHPVLMPMLRIAPLDDWTQVDAALTRITEYDWLIFTSVNGVDAFLGRLWELGRDVRRLANVKVAVIGEATARRVEEYRLQADLVPDVYRAEALAEALAPHVSGRRVLWARADRGRDILPQALSAAGANVEPVVVYHHEDAASLPPEADALLRAGKLDWIALSSPSIARRVSELVPPELRRHVKLAAISPVTAEAAKEAGLEISAIAQTHTWPGLLEAIVSSERRRPK